MFLIVFIDAEKIFNRKYPNLSKLIFLFFFQFEFCLLNKKDWLLKVFLLAFSKTTTGNEYTGPLCKNGLLVQLTVQHVQVFLDWQDTFF